MSNKRPSWDEYFLDLVDSVASRATCDRGRSGCLIARDKRIIATGYVGSPVGFPHCDEAGHDMKKVVHEDGSESMHCMRTVHAEQNAICQAARNGIPLEDGTLYCSMVPCRTCAMLIINVGIVRVVAKHQYHASSDTLGFFEQAGVVLEVLNDAVQEY